MCNVKPFTAAVAVAAFCLVSIGIAFGSSVAATKYAGSRSDTAPKPFIIVPGLRVGRLLIHDEAMVIERKLGDQHYSDCGMGEYYYTWYSRSSGHRRPTYCLTTYCSRGEDDYSYLRQIRVESPAFHTDNGIRTGMQLAAITKQFPHLKRSVHQIVLKRAKRFWLDIYDDETNGIGFEILRPEHDPSGTGRCIAILVHEKHAQALLFDPTITR